MIFCLKYLTNNLDLIQSITFLKILKINLISMKIQYAIKNIQNYLKTKEFILSLKSEIY